MTAEPTIEQLKAEIIKANDIIQVLEAQRNKAANETATVLAELQAANRKVAELEKAAEGAPVEGEIIPPPKVNGRADAHAAA